MNNIFVINKKSYRKFLHVLEKYLLRNDEAFDKDYLNLLHATRQRLKDTE